MVWTLLNGLVGGFFPLFGMVLNSSGFSGHTSSGFDGTMTASTVERVQAGTWPWGWSYCWQWRQSSYSRQRKYRHPVPMLLGIAALQMVASVFMDVRGG